VKVSLPQTAILVGSGSKMEDSVEGDRQVVTLAGGPMRDFFLAAGAGLEKTSIKVGETLVNSYSSMDLMDGNKSALDTASAAIRVFDKIIGNYPYTEFDVLATSTSALGVEYPGVTVINKNIYRPGGNLNDVPNSIYLESTVAHEVGHQWFYNVVGNDQVNQPWLDESITQYITSLYYKDRYGDQASDSFITSFYDRWDRVNEKEIPIGMPVRSYDQKTYGAIIYGRGPIFFITLSDQIGDTDFALFLKNYYEQNMWEIASETTLKEAAEKACSCNLTMLFNRWVDPK
jgi:aminopeptidase N